MTIVMQFGKCSRNKMYNKKQVCQEVVPRSQPKSTQSIISVE